MPTPPLTTWTTPPPPLLPVDDYNQRPRVVAPTITPCSPTTTTIPGDGDLHQGAPPRRRHQQQPPAASVDEVQAATADSDELSVDRIMDTGGQMQKVFHLNSFGTIGVRFLWNILHLVLSIWFMIVSVSQILESFLISNGYPESYRTLNIHKIKYLVVAIDSEEAKQTEKVVRLLEWLTTIGVKNVCLYDTEGILKKSKDTIEKCEDVRNSLGHQNVEVEFTSFLDGKEAIAKAANFLSRKYYSASNQEKPNLAELHMEEALEAIGCGGPQPDLLLIYAPTRIHLGFPAWRIRYTEIVHMGSLNSMKFGLLIKAIHKFTMVRQNYGT